jgi:hypothetical protein
MARGTVHLISGKRAKYLGVVAAPTEHDAVQKAIETFHIPPALQSKISVSKLDGGPAQRVAMAALIVMLLSGATAAQNASRSAGHSQSAAAAIW